MVPVEGGVINPLSVIHTDSQLVYENDLVARNARIDPPAASSDAHVDTLVDVTLPRAGRSPGRKDRDRLVYAEGFHRLAGVTQVMSPNLHSPRMHNRFTHSLKVGQLARSIAEAQIRLARNDTDLKTRILELGGLDADVAESAGLAHDIGHAPFGHIGEAALDRIARSSTMLPGALVFGLMNGFEGNAQTFRCITKLDPYKHLGLGLNLTSATRAAVIKYPWARAPLHLGRQEDHELKYKQERLYRLHWDKFGYYESELTEFEDARSWLPGEIKNNERQSLEATVMDIADDITYAIHDFEDYYRANHLDLREVIKELTEFLLEEPPPENRFRAVEAKLQRDYPNQFELEALKKSVKKVKNELSTQFEVQFQGTDLQMRKLRQFVSRLLGELVNAVKFEKGTPRSDVGAYLFLDTDAWHTIQVFKAILFEFVIAKSDFGLAQRGQQHVIESLANHLLDWSNSTRKNGASRLPPRFQEGLDSCGPNSTLGPRERAVLDFVCTLTDAQAYDMFQTLNAITNPEIVHPKSR